MSRHGLAALAPRLVAFVALVVASGCGAATEPARASAGDEVVAPAAPRLPVKPPAAPPALEAECPEPPCDAPSSSAAARSAEPPSEPAPSPRAFPPPSFEPLHARTAAPNDGTWAPMGAPESGGRSLMVRSSVHPDRVKKHVHVAVVAFDLAAVEVRLVAGKREPASAAVAAERRSGLVPLEVQDRLLVVFNGGFMAQHGRWGMRIGEDEFLPPRAEGCAVALLHDGGVRIAPWPELSSASPSEIAAYRQTPPCMITRGETHPELARETQTKRWGAADGGVPETRRSAVGLDPSGRVLFYGLGEWVTAKAMADAMRAAGSTEVAQLDINWGYTRFLVFGRRSAAEPLEVIETLIPKIEHSRRGYVERPSDKDFFYVTAARPLGTSGPHRRLPGGP